ncbi:MAG TPA: DUF1761 family protein [Caulobacteraceae bacterium]
MRFSRYLVVVVIGVVVSACIDWLLSGVLFHGAYNATPEIWRTGLTEATKIGYSAAFSVIGVAAFAWLVGRSGRPDLRSALLVALAAWLAGPVPVLLTDLIWIKLDSTAVAVNGAEWLARFVVTGLAAAALL